MSDSSKKNIARSKTSKSPQKTPNDSDSDPKGATKTSKSPQKTPNDSDADPKGAANTSAGNADKASPLLMSETDAENSTKIPISSTKTPNKGSDTESDIKDKAGNSKTSSPRQSTGGNSGRSSIKSPKRASFENDAKAAPQSTRQRRLEYLRSGTDADCEVHVPVDAEEGINVCYKKFRCHRIFLASASEKLEQDIFQNKLWNGVLQINGVSPESVEVFLEYVYTFEVTSPLANLTIIGDIFILSCAYNMPEFLRKFSEQLKNIDWPLEGIFPALNLAFQHNIMDLENACLEKIMESAAELKTQSNIMELKIYAFNYVIQHWLTTEAIGANELIQLLQQYQQKNNLNFSNPQQFSHFTKIIKYFPNVLLDAEGFISKY